MSSDNNLPVLHNNTEVVSEEATEGQDFVLGERTFKSNLEIAMQYLHTEGAQEALRKDPSWAKKIVEAVRIFEEELMAEEGNITKAAMSMVVGHRIWGSFRTTKKKGTWRPSGHAWVVVNEQWFLREFRRGEELPDKVDCYQAGAWSKLTSCKIDEKGTWRPKADVIFDHLYFPLTVENTVVQVRAWDLLQGEHIEVLLEDPIKYRRLKAREKLIEKKAKAEEAKAKAAEAAEAAAKAKAEKEARALYLKEQEELRRKRKKIVKEISVEVNALGRALHTQLGALHADGDIEGLLDLDDESLDFLLSPPKFSTFVADWWLANADLEATVFHNLGRALMAYVPKPVQNLMDRDALVNSIKEALK